MKEQVWRRVNKLAIECTNCRENTKQLGGPDRCMAKDEICIFTGTKIDGQETWSNFHDLYHDVAKEEGTE